MKLYRTAIGPVVQENDSYFQLPQQSWDALINRDDLLSHLKSLITNLKSVKALPSPALAPIVSQEVWAAGVTYYRSRDARMEEAQDSGGGSFYDKVYNAPRPELFMKTTALRVVGHKQAVRIRRDSNWNVPEPEWTLVVTSSGKVVGFTVGNDMSSRDIEGENPLYLPQAKVWDACCALGPCIYVSDAGTMPKETKINVKITRSGKVEFDGTTTLAELKRTPQELVGYLFRECSFPHGTFMMTGTGIVPPTPWTLAVGDVVAITIDGIGTLENPVERKG